MMNLFKRIAAALVCLLLVIGCFAGCHGKDAVVATAKTADGTEITIPAGLYIAMQIAADSETRNLVVEQLGEKATGDINYAKQTVTVDGKSYSFYDYVDIRTEEICRDYIATRYLFDKNKCELSETELSTMTGYVQYQWAYTGGAYLYEPNGVSYNSFEQYMRVINYERSNLFDFYYDNGGEKEPSEDIIKKGLGDNFLIANVIEITTKGSDNKTLPEEKLKELEAKLQAYADRINKGEAFKVINDEYEAEKKKAEEEAKKEETSSGATSSSASSAVSSTASGAASSAAASSAAASSAATSSAASSTVTSSGATASGSTASGSTEAKPQPKDSLAKIYGSDKSSASSSLFSEFKKLEVGKATVVKGTDGYYRLVILKDIHADEYYYNEYSNEVTRILYAEEFETFVSEEGKKITITYDSYERDYLDADNIDYTDYQAWYSSMYSGYTG